MHRNKILDLLNQYTPQTANERLYKKNMIDFIVENQNCFERSLLKGHMTASAWIIDAKNENCLLLHHKKLNAWYQPGGHADGESDLFLVACKEVNEETGLTHIKPIIDGIFDIDIHETPEYKGIQKHLHYDVRFLLQTSTENTIKKNGESFDLQWFPKNISLLPNKQPSIIRMFTKWEKLKL